MEFLSFAIINLKFSLSVSKFQDVLLTSAAISYKQPCRLRVISALDNHRKDKTLSNSEKCVKYIVPIFLHPYYEKT